MTGQIWFVEDRVSFWLVLGDDLASDAENDDRLRWLCVGFLWCARLANLPTDEMLEICATAIPAAAVSCPELTYVSNFDPGLESA